MILDLMVMLKVNQFKNYQDLLYYLIILIFYILDPLLVKLQKIMGLNFFEIR